MWWWSKEQDEVDLARGEDGIKNFAFRTTDMSFGYEGQPLLLKKTDFGIDMQSRGM